MKALDKKNKNKLENKKKKVCDEQNQPNQRTTAPRCNLKKKTESIQHFSHTGRTPSTLPLQGIESILVLPLKATKSILLLPLKVTINSLLPLKAT